MVEMQQLKNKTRLWLGAKRVVYLNYNHKDKNLWKYIWNLKMNSTLERCQIFFLWSNEVMNEIITWYQQIIHVCRAKLNQVSKSRNNDIWYLLCKRNRSSTINHVHETKYEQSLTLHDMHKYAPLRNFQ